MALDKKKTIRLLILEDSQNEAERLVSLFRNAGRATRVHRIVSAEDLEQQLQQGWDLLIAAAHSEALEPQEALAALRKLDKDIPFIQLLEDNEPDRVTEALMYGAADALPEGEDERLVLVATRELKNLEERRGRRSAEISLREAEKRCQLLLDSSVDAIAYIHDGMHIYVNRAYMEMFGHDDPDDLAAEPVIGLIAPADQAQFKDFLKQHRGENTDLKISGARADGSQFKASMSFSPATYDGEPCTQLLIRGEADNAELEERLREAASLDLVTGLFNRNHFLEQSQQLAERVVQAQGQACVGYLLIDNYTEILADIGIGKLDLLLADIANMLRQQFAAPSLLARFGDDVFTVLTPDTTPKQRLEHYTAFSNAITEHLFEVDGRTVQVKLSTGLAGLSEATHKANLVIERAHRCAEDAQQAGGNCVKAYDPSVELAAAANRGDVVAAIKQALEQNSFRLMFQPVISLRGDPHEHYEVLLRLKSGDDKEMDTTEVIAAAKTANLAEKVDRWVILNSIKLLAEHRSKGHNTRLFINLSGPSLQDPGLLPWLGKALKAARLPTDSLTFQFNETDAIAYLRSAKTLTEGLAELHCQVAISQFGCAANPFNTLKHLTVNFIKVDGSYVQELNDADSQQALKDLTATIHSQAKLTIVPYVESASALATLWQAGVNYIQGHYLQGPSAGMNYDFGGGDE
ncbi:EAL domain-containing response regulator [Atopomonas sediminilitoris]|uniref:EAL domain-containing response regulator n=1 Tax=Atopomonas sediminilitoris TaxID=2919919 RepID=UPI001F4E6674|nr:EAL domain-containing protein [Atopomonas sediminilitoris]MCJ8170266.1 EAL domain-containing protein [Atopomonas sediminilitoris]